MVGMAVFSFVRVFIEPAGRANGLKEKQLFSLFCNYGLRYSTGFSYSTTTEAAADQTAAADHFLVDYLSGSLNFSRDEATSAAAKVSQLRSQEKPSKVVDYLKGLGMDLTHIKSAVSKFPKVLFCDPEKTLDPKIQYLKEIGLSGSALVRFITRDASFLCRGLDTHLKPALEFLREAAGGKQNALKALKRSGWLLSYGSYKTMQDNVMVLRGLGFSDEKIQQFVMARPSCLTNRRPGWMDKILHRVEKEFGIPRNSPMFYNGVYVATALSEKTVEKKLEILRSFGWSNSEISIMVQKQPHTLTISEDRLKKVLNFLMNKLGYGSDYLAFRPMFLMSSLEKKTIPRSQVLKILKENNVKSCSLSTALSLTESKFSHVYLLPYKNKLPDMYEGYITIMAK